EDDLYRILMAATEGTLAELPPFRWDNAHACGVVLASAGYPSEPVTGLPIQGLELQDPNALIFHGGTRRDAQTNDVCSSGGRVLTVVGKGATAEEARTAAYARANHIHFEGCRCRNDIGVVGPDVS
ncbi:MAG: phosphoribosylglycinamide synthetase C domain-containing protein, partial [Chloroflexota bacterium]